jgi:hypothetical protein
MASAASAEVPPANASRRDGYLPALLAVLAVALLSRLLLLTATHAAEEDFYITLRYAVNIAAGRGFVYNPGESVLGATTPLYTLLLALLIRLHLDPILCARLMGIGADLISCVAIYSLGRTAGRPGAGVAAALCLAVLPTNLIWATKGMEVELVAAAVAVSWAAWAMRRETLAWAAAAVLALLRIDGAALAVVMLLASVGRDRRLPWRGLLLFIMLVTPWAVYATATFGSPVPASLRAKLIVYGRDAAGHFPRLLPFLQLMTHRQGIILVLGCLFALGGLLISLRGRRQGDPPPAEWLLIPPALWMLAHYAVMALSKVFLFGWYFVPPTPIYYLVAMTGWNLALDRYYAHRAGPDGGRNDAGRGSDGRSRDNGRDKQRPYSIIVAITVAVGLVLSVIFVPAALRDLRETQDVEDRLRIPIGLWLRDHARPTDHVMLEPIGYIGYYSGLRVLDTVALVSPEVLPCYAPQVASPYHAMWTRFQPEWILLRAGEWNTLQRYEQTLPQSERLLARYRHVRDWTDPAFPNAPPGFILFHRASDGSGKQ